MSLQRQVAKRYSVRVHQSVLDVVYLWVSLLILCMDINMEICTMNLNKYTDVAHTSHIKAIDLWREFKEVDICVFH